MQPYGMEGIVVALTYDTFQAVIINPGYSSYVYSFKQ